MGTRKIWHFSYLEILCGPVMHIWALVWREISLTPQRYMDIHVRCSINHSSHAMEPVQMSSMGGWVKAVSCEHSAELSHFWRTLVSGDTQKTRDSAGGRCVKQNKPDSHRPTPHAFLLCRIHFRMCVHVFIRVFTWVNRTWTLSGSCVGKEGIKKEEDQSDGKIKIIVNYQSFSRSWIQI